MIDAISSTFVPVLSRIGDDIDDLEQQVITEASAEHLQRIFSLKRDVVAMRRVVSPMRDMFARDADTITNLPELESDDRLYYRDLYDSMIRATIFLPLTFLTGFFGQNFLFLHTHITDTARSFLVFGLGSRCSRLSASRSISAARA